MIKCEWIYCKYNEQTGICNCTNDIKLRCATVEDFQEEGILQDELLCSDMCGNVLMCDNYETMD